MLPVQANSLPKLQGIGLEVQGLTKG